MVIETDLKYIEEVAEERSEENWEFRSFLKQLDMASEEVDAIVHQITDEVTAQIDCTTLFLRNKERFLFVAAIRQGF